MIGRPGSTALMLVAGVLPAAQVDEIEREAAAEKLIAELSIFTMWQWAKTQAVLIEARSLGIPYADLLAEAKSLGVEGVEGLLARARSQIDVEIDRAPLPRDIHETVHSFRVGNRLARRLGCRR